FEEILQIVWDKSCFPGNSGCIGLNFVAERLLEAIWGNHVFWEIQAVNCAFCFLETLLVSGINLFFEIQVVSGGIML
ncbi:hypothetical protein, partial [Treponema sp.]|uniref:hypothetical protein n=1 Tax=Treponema sp. TaxID=166 RepID=UPI0025D356E6